MSTIGYNASTGFSTLTGNQSSGVSKRNRLRRKLTNATDASLARSANQQFDEVEAEVARQIADRRGVDVTVTHPEGQYTNRSW